jgi:paraquat-inducible protein B
VPFFIPGLYQHLNEDYRIPVEVRIEPERLISQLGGDPNIRTHIDDLINRGLRGSLKTGNLVTGALYIDLDFYPKRLRAARFRSLEPIRSFQQSAVVWRRSSSA